MADKPVGKVQHYYDKIGVAIIEFSKSVKVGETIKIIGKDGTEITQTVNSMQYEHEPITEAKKGQSVGVKVDKVVKENDLVYAV